MNWDQVWSQRTPQTAVGLVVSLAGFSVRPLYRNHFNRTLPQSPSSLCSQEVLPCYLPLNFPAQVTSLEETSLEKTVRISFSSRGRGGKEVLQWERDSINKAGGGGGGLGVRLRGLEK